MSSRWATLKIISSLIMSFILVASSQTAAASNRSNSFVVTIQPGESKSLVLPIKSTSDFWSTRYIVITGNNTSSANGGITTLATSSCTGIQKAFNASGYVLYQWSSRTEYDYTGTTANIWGHIGTPGSWWGWGFHSEIWVGHGNGTATARAVSIGYFTHVTGAKEYARIEFVVQKNGSCTMSGSIGKW
ncbi:MAG TPA: hypothetical protein VFS21_34340 [Roseiflexaceae bacterium]|nr:hypothetical protein [Roseiflexaceae bacterium]